MTPGGNPPQRNAKPQNKGGRKRAETYAHTPKLFKKDKREDRKLPHRNM